LIPDGESHAINGSEPVPVSKDVGAFELDDLIVGGGAEDEIHIRISLERIHKT